MLRVWRQVLKVAEFHKKSAVGESNRAKGHIMKGLGHIYLRKGGKIYWIKYRKDGKQFYESSYSKMKKVAIELLKKRIASPIVVKDGPVRIGELLDDYKAYAQVHNPKSYQLFGLQRAEKLRDFWGDRKASKITSREIDDYIEMRLAEPKQRGGGQISNGTVNRDAGLSEEGIQFGEGSNAAEGGIRAEVPHAA
jgi:hypothetical protein